MFNQKTNFSLASGCLLFAVGCASVNYDAQADSQLTKITQEINQQLITWEDQAKTKLVPYDAKFYNKLEADVKTLEIRMEASQDPTTPILIEVFQNIDDQIEKARNFHKSQSSKKIRPELFHAERENLNFPFATLITFELSLKPGAAGGSQPAKTQSTAVATTQAKASGTSAQVSKITGQ